MKYNEIVSQEYSIAITEVLDILSNFSEETLKKIPKKLMKFFKEVSIEDYTTEFNTERLENVRIRDKTKALLAMIYRNYLCTESEKKEFDEKLLKNEEEYQKLLRQKYDPDNFKNKKEENEQTAKLTDNVKTDLIEYKEEKWYKRILKVVLSFFKR